ncbi:MAG: dethiobiotin synthase [Pirellulales bacterium]
MSRAQPPGLFIIGADTGVGKTYVAALIAQALVAAGVRVGVYKPAASGCTWRGDELVSDDALALWQAAGQPGTLSRVCPQRFEAPLAPHLAAEAEGRELDAALLRTGLDYWREQSEFVLVEGAGGFLSPLGPEDYVANLAAEFGYPLVVVVRNAVGAINQALQTLVAVTAWAEELSIAGIVLNQTEPRPDDPSLATNRREIELRAQPPVLAELGYGAKGFGPAVDWRAV